MRLRQELAKLTTAELKALLAKPGTITTFERELIIRIVQERLPPRPAKPNPVKQGLLDAQMDWIDSL